MKLLHSRRQRHLQDFLNCFKRFYERRLSVACKSNEKPLLLFWQDEKKDSTELNGNQDINDSSLSTSDPKTSFPIYPNGENRKCFDVYESLIN